MHNTAIKRQDLKPNTNVRELALNDQSFALNTKQFELMMKMYEDGLEQVKLRVEIIKHEYEMSPHNPIERVCYRLKTPESILKKLEKYGCEPKISFLSKKINDIAGIRVICPYISDIYVISTILMEQEDFELIKMRDYIQYPKQNGYRSLHMVMQVPVYRYGKKVRVELQLRTPAMDLWASLEHRLCYKAEKAVPCEIAAKLKECAEDIAKADKELQHIVWKTS